MRQHGLHPPEAQQDSNKAYSILQLHTWQIHGRSPCFHKDGSICCYRISDNSQELEKGKKPPGAARVLTSQQSLEMMMEKEKE